MQKEMRQVFGEALLEIGRENENIVVLDADLSSSTKSAIFAKEFPERFFNIGIAEQNMVSMAAGMASCGKIPFVCSFAFLLALRAADQVRSHVAYQHLNVKLVGGTPGLTGSFDGATHQSVMDLAVMRAIPGMTVIVPSDEVYTREAVLEAARCNGPVYIRVSRLTARKVHGDRDKFIIGKAVILKDGIDVTIIAMGTMVEKALDAADRLKNDGINAEVLEISTLKPIDSDLILKSLKKTGAAVTVEEHSRIGGLYSAVMESIGNTVIAPVEWVAIDDRFGESGKYEELLALCGLTIEKIVEKAKDVIITKSRYKYVLR